MFWTDSSFEPKMDFKWYIVLRGKDNVPSYFIEKNKSIAVKPDGVHSFLAKKVSKPTFSINSKQYNLINRKVNIPGNVTWDPISLTMVDTVDNSLSDFLKEYFFYANVRYDKSNITGIANIETVSKKHLSNLTLEIHQIDSEGNDVETWTLVDLMITKIGKSDLDYGNDNISEYTLEITYDWAYEGQVDLLTATKSKKENVELEKNILKTSTSTTTPKS